MPFNAGRTAQLMDGKSYCKMPNTQFQRTPVAQI